MTTRKGRVAATLAIGLMLVIVASVPAGAVNRAGDARIVDADRHKPLAEGGSRTAFSLTLPSGAACPGDSEHDQYRVMSYFVPERYDPGALRYDLGPIADGGQALFKLDTRRYINDLTERAEKPGGEGVIQNVPGLSFAVFNRPGAIAPGRYRIGVACTLLFETKRYWGATIDVARDEADAPAGIHWTVVGAPATSDDGPGVLPLTIGGVVAGGVVLFAWTGSRRRSRVHARGDVR